MEQMTLEQYQDALKEQGVPHQHMAFVCPMCGTVQSAHDLISAGAGNSFDDVEKYIGFSCIGRWTGASSPRKKPDGNPCNWTLGGLFSCHKIEVIVDGEKYPRFQPATPEQAQLHMKGGM